MHPFKPSGKKTIKLLNNQNCELLKLSIMKAKAFFSAIVIFVILLSADVFAQRGARTPGSRMQPQQRYAQPPAERAERPQRMMPEDCVMIPDLTEEQQAAIKQIRLDGLQKATSHRNQMDELRARKRNLMTQAQPDMAAVNNIIDEMTTLQNAQMKERAAHRQAIRNQLTDEQRVMFDNRAMRRSGARMNHGRPADAPGMRRR